MSRARMAIAVSISTIAVVGLGGPADATVSERTERMSAGVGGATSDGVSTHPAITADGRFVAFDSTATNLTRDGNGSVRDVFVRDLGSGATTLVSRAANGEAANGPSQWPALSDGAARVAFRSAASNLVWGDTNGVPDIFVREADGQIVRVSVATDGTEGNRQARDLDISADGRLVAFSSFASNLVAGDTNDTEDVFVRNLDTGETVLVSQRDGTRGNGRSRAPAISSDGGYMSFYSVANNLVNRDVNRTGDVFLATLNSPQIELVSRSSTGAQQNSSVLPPFAQVSDVSRGGHFVVFDSDATNLVRRDRNRDTDVFVRHIRRDITVRVSVGAGNREGDNDSFSPSISPEGRFVAFESFAGNLFPGDSRGEDVFLFDRKLGATTIVDVSASGEPRGTESVSQLLQRPVVSDDGVVGFTSTSPLLTAGDSNELEDVFVRRTTPPIEGVRRMQADSKGRYKLSFLDSTARVFLCQVGGRPDFLCPASGRVAAISRRRPRRMVVRAGGPGVRFSDWTLKIPLGRR